LGLPSPDQPFVTGTLETASGKVPQVSASPQWADHWGTFKARWGVGRMNYKIDPGIYALGQPTASSKVFVTANYKMSFDCLRQALAGMDAWILALDTKGINVWCAAGKGTFGTEELVRRIRASGLEKIVNHREIILPQLGAPGVAVHRVNKLSGFKAIYGPIRAADIPAFLSAGMKATPEMRKKDFPFRERAVLIPVELVEALKSLAAIIPILLLLSGLIGGEGFWENIGKHGLFAVLAVVIGLVMGAVANPLFLPYLPGRAFSLKGLFLGILGGILLLLLPSLFGIEGITGMEKISWGLIVSALSAFLAMNFTGASTYTSLSGVKKEMRWAVPLEIAGASLGIILWIGSLALRF